MKSKICCCMALLIFGCFSSALGQGIKSEALCCLPISKLKSVDVLSDYELVGWTGKHEFFRLSKEFLRDGTERDFKRFLSDRNPVVRAMGLLCLAQTDLDKHFLTLLSHTKDKEEVSLAHGCVISRMRVCKSPVGKPVFPRTRRQEACDVAAAQQSLAADGAIACFSNNVVPSARMLIARRS